MNETALTILAVGAGFALGYFVLGPLLLAGLLVA